MTILDLNIQQAPLPLSYRTASGLENFAVSNSNALAVDYLDQWPNWLSHAVCLVGAACSGKSHLAAIFAARTGAKILTADKLENRPRVPAIVIDTPLEGQHEEALFHLYNWTQEARISLLLTSRTPPSQWTFQLPDLKSRLCSLPVLTLQAPDDALIGALLVKRFRDLGLNVGPDVIEYLLPRLERDYSKINQLVLAIDQKALSVRRNVTIPLVRSLLEQSS